MAVYYVKRVQKAQNERNQEKTAQSCHDDNSVRAVFGQNKKQHTQHQKSSYIR